MENIMKPEPHKIIHVVRQTTAEFTIRVACDKDPGYGQFFQLSEVAETCGSVGA